MEECYENMWQWSPRVEYIFILLAFLLPSISVAAQEGNAVINKIVNELEAGTHDGVTGGMASVNGEIIFEAYAPGYTANKQHDIRSATKSITALLMGALIDEKKLKNTRIKLSDVLKDDFAALPRGDAKRSITIENLLTMRGGLACDDWSPASVGHEDKMYQTSDWFSFWVSSPIAYEIGKHFSYCTGGVVALGRAIEKQAGISVPQYAETKLFGPLGITGAKWEKTPKGYTDTGGHLRLRLKDLHTIGLLVAAGGVWDGQQIVSKHWIEEMTKPQTRIPERRQQYGYLWWYDEGKAEGQPVSIIYAHGNGGNFITIVPELGLVAAFTGKNYGKPSQFTAFQILTRELVPSLVEASSQ